ncbi:alkaline phosphatase family protein [Dongia sedimenti]|uniref:Alkaline phosphatase family protein n=1 Tax=Dongia sedimenti TaxID=3064282 RepID=A0ABU0YTM8_9PROT|nr:alkaline phosphatase family protein [Rhodospirillaceae bacterium R-7]
MARPRRILIASFDGLRSDLISPELTPNLVRLQETGTTLARHRTIYPSETRTAFPSLVTGATPNRHGLIGNKYVDRASRPERYLDTSDSELLARLDHESGGRLMTAPTLGEILAAAGRSLAVLSTNTPGTTRLFHHKAEAFGHVRLSGHFREACTPADTLAAIEKKQGALPPLPPRGEPDRDGQDYITTAFLDCIEARLKPDVTVISYGEPDVCSHLNGTGATKTREIIAFCDRQFGRVLDWWDAEGRDQGVQIFATCDHGQITGHSRVSVLDRLRAAGFAPAHAPGVDVDVVAVPGQVGALYLKERNQASLTRLVEALLAEPWCGPIFTAAKNDVEGLAPGSFGSHLVFAEHDRAPDVYFAFRADDSIDPFGLTGGTYYDNDRRPGLGVHGGLHPKELTAVGLAAGSAFRQGGFVSLTPSGVCDLAPTTLYLLGLPIAASMTGRILSEILADGAPIAEPIRAEALETGHAGYTQMLQRVHVGSTTYIEGGWANSAAAAAPRNAERLN